MDLQRSVLDNDPWNLPVADLRILLGDHTPSLVVERFGEHCMVSGFFNLDANFLLGFLQKWRLHALVQLENSRVQIVFSAEPFTVEPDAALRAVHVEYNLYTKAEAALIRSVVGQFGELPVTQLSVVMMPRVMHVQFVPKIGIPNDLISNVMSLSGVKTVRFGGVKCCIEVILLRPKNSKKKEGNSIRVRNKNLRRVRVSAKTQVITPLAVSLEE